MTTATREPRIPSEIGPDESFGTLEDIWDNVPLARAYCEALEPATAAPHQFHVFALFNIVGTILGRSYGLRYAGTRPLFAPHYTLLLGPTHTAHKSTALEAAERLLNEATGNRIRVTSASGSGEGLIEALAYAGCDTGEDRKRVREAMADHNIDVLAAEYRGKNRLQVMQDEFSSIIRKSGRVSELL